MSKINEQLAEISNPTVHKYLRLMGDTETPPLFHVWCLVSAASAAMTRRVWFNAGSIRVMPNQFIMLVGPPGVRKSQGIKFARGLLKGIDGFRFGPNNTAGRPQGLIASMLGRRLAEEDESDAVREVMETVENLDMGFLTEEEQASLPEQHTHVLNRHAVYVAEGELVSFLGMKAHEFNDFLSDMWDKSGEELYHYALKREEVRLDYPCLNIIGAITPMHITSYLPPTAIGQGFTSRVIMCYEDRGKKVAWPEPINEAGLADFRKLMYWIFEACNGEMDKEPGVREAVEQLYEYELPIADIRFLHYAQRRQSHMFKVAMALCVLRQSMTMSVHDIYDAHKLLQITEQRMPECLGEYGMSPLALAISRVTDVLKHSSEPLTINRVIIASGSDVRRIEITRALHELANNEQIIELTLRDPRGTIRTGYVWPRESNPFKAHEEIAVEYLVDESTSAASRSGKSGRPTLRQSATGLTGEQDSYADEMPAVPRFRQPAVDFDSLPEEMAYEMAEVSSLAAQGFASVHDKLKSFLNSKRTIN